MTEVEGFNERERLLKKRNKDGAGKLLFEAIKRTRYERIFSYRCKRGEYNG